MPGNTVDGDLLVTGRLRVGTFVPPNDAIGNEHVDAARPIGADKLYQKYNRLITQPHGVAVVSRREVIHLAHTAMTNGGVVESLDVGVAVANIGAATITFLLLKNGVNILSAPLVLDNTVAAYDTIPGTFISTTFTAGDVFELQVTAAAGGGTLGQGLFANLVVKEPPV